MNILNIFEYYRKQKKDSNKDDDDDGNNLIKVINYVVLDCTFLMLSMMMMIMVMVTLIDEKTFSYLMIMSYKQYGLLSRIYRQRIL